MSRWVLLAMSAAGLSGVCLIVILKTLYALYLPLLDILISSIVGQRTTVDDNEPSVQY